MPLVILFCCHTPCWVILCHTLFQGEWSKLDLLVQRRVGYKRKKGNSNEWISFFLKRCLAESNRSTRFCRPLPNRSVKTPCRVFCYHFWIASAKVLFLFGSTKFFIYFFQKTFIFYCFSLVFSVFTSDFLFFCSHFSRKGQLAHLKSLHVLAFR